MNYLAIILITIAGVILGWYFGRRRKENFISKYTPSRNSETAEVKKENKEKILKFIQENQRVKNNDVEKLLGVSDATAIRYLDEMEKERKIQQIGTTGQSVYYVSLSSDGQ